MDNLHLFHLINAAPGLEGWRLFAATAVAEWLIYLVPLVMTFAWFRGNTAARIELLRILLATLIALGVAQVVSHFWPQSRPFALHLGTQYLGHAIDPGLPSDHVTVFWSLALASLSTRRFAVWGFPLLSVGLLVGWARVYLGVHFPFDIVGALPVALAGAAAAYGLARPLAPLFVGIAGAYDRLALHARCKSVPLRKP